MAALKFPYLIRSIYSSEVSLSEQSSSSSGSWKHLLRSDEKGHVQSCSTSKFYKTKWFRVLAVLLVLGVLSSLIWVFLALGLPKRHTPNSPLNGVSSLVDDWKSPEDSMHLLSPWKADFTQGINPIPCHSHNDYWRSVPLYKALAAGCTGVEADIYLPTEAGSKDLLVGHTSGSLTQTRTLESLYTGPLITILDNLNNISDISDGRASDWIGIFQSSPNTTLTLLLDFKSNGPELWPYVNEQLESLRSKGWLTHWNISSGITWAPIIIVGTGNAPFDLLNSNNTYRDIFYDAPLDDISNPIYDNTNSYYASVSMARLGKQWLWKFSPAQLNKISAQIDAASSKGLKARYWDTPVWSVTFRDYIWGILVEKGVGMLNVDVFSFYFILPVTDKIWSKPTCMKAENVTERCDTS
ncbi:Altered inheritance of mitochondria protein-like protein [Lachnellula occidentalis]|uniref:Altered inheritance of mitochondria protein 6 n=1 Tax=Lachnellula occidentalis TaxID=215460 RepID=A0A8H8UHT6_9HELO|nr:Altered inheritance of mitochondria protein-like protein [Lachnellula occidentalis]